MKVLGFESTITLNFWSLFVDPACRGAMAAVQGAEIHKRRVGREERGDEYFHRIHGTGLLTFTIKDPPKSTEIM